MLRLLRPVSKMSKLIRRTRKNFEFFVHSSLSCFFDLANMYRITVNV